MADHAALVASFLYRVFIKPNQRSMAQPDLAAKLDDFLFEIGRDGFPKTAAEYLDDWASDRNGWLRKYYPADSDQPHFDLTPATEKAIEWLSTLQQRHFVGVKRQISLLTPLVADCDLHASHAAEAAGLRECRDHALRPWFAGFKADLLETRLANLGRDFARQEGKVADLTLAQGTQQKRKSEIEQALRENGGDRLKALRSEIAKAGEERDARRRRADEHDKVVAALRFPSVTDHASFEANRTRLTREREEAQARQAEAQNALVEAGVTLRTLKTQHDTVAAD